MKQIVCLLLSVFMLYGCSKPVNEEALLFAVDSIKEDDPIVEITQDEVDLAEVEIADEIIIKSNHP